MPKPIPKILAIVPGTRYFALAVSSGYQLRDWRIKSLKGKWSKGKIEKIKAIISNYISRYGINNLAIKRVDPVRSSHNLKELTRRIKEFAKRKGIKVFEYSLEDIKKFFSGEKINKRQLAELVGSRYQELFSKLYKEKNNKNPYYSKIFEAVALCLVCLSQLEKYY